MQTLLLLVAGALALAGGAGDAPDAPDALDASDASEAADAGASEASEASEGDEEAWRVLWAGALDALRRAPRLNDTREDVHAQLGATAYLHCPVTDLGEQGVSWVRRRDWHIISAGQLVYTNDERFQVLHSEGSDEWTLQIKYVQQRDNGTYECQVSTSAGVVSRQVTLSVSVPEAFILGGDEHHVDDGSDLSLVCIIEKSPEPPQYVFWYHNERMINYDAARGVRVRTERGHKTQSSLLVRAARPQHAGNYTCRAANAQPATIAVYVVAGDKMAATLTRNMAPLMPRAAPPALLPLLLLLRLLRPPG